MENDLISRHGVSAWLANMGYSKLADVVMDEDRLPPAQPEKRTDKRTGTHACDCISRQEAIDALDVLCQEHRYKIPGKGETYSQYNEAWQDALDRAEGAIFNLPSAQPKSYREGYQAGFKDAQPEIVRCKDCKWFNDIGCAIYIVDDSDKPTENDYCSYGERREVSE